MDRRDIRAYKDAMLYFIKSDPDVRNAIIKISDHDSQQLPDTVPDDIMHRVSELENELNTLYERCQLLEKEKSVFQNRCIALEKEKNEVVKLTVELKNEINSLNEKCNSIEKDRKNLQNRCFNVEKDREIWRTKCSTLLDDRDCMHEKCFSLENKYNHLLSKYLSLENAYEKYNNLDRETLLTFSKTIDDTNPVTFLISGATEESIRLIHENICSKWERYSEGTLSVINEIFDYLFEMFRINNTEYNRMTINYGDIYDPSIHLKTFNSLPAGKVTRILSAGYTGKDGKIIGRSLVKLG